MCTPFSPGRSTWARLWERTLGRELKQGPSSLSGPGVSVDIKHVNTGPGVGGTGAIQASQDRDTVGEHFSA